jgi:hypothetical protein
MQTSWMNLNRPCRAARLAATLSAFAALCTAAVSAQTTPYAEFQNATLTATTNTINVTNLPVVTSDGTIVYYNVTIPFTVTSNANEPLTAGSITSVQAPRATVSNFMAGIYGGPDNSTELVNVSSPGATQGGGTEWSLSPATGASGCLEPGTASWFVGTLTSKTDPTLYTRVTKAGIVPGSNSLFFGTGTQIGVGASCGQSAWDYPSALLGFAQTGNQITIYSFTDFNGGDHNFSQAQKTYCLVGSTGCPAK